MKELKDLIIANMKETGKSPDELVAEVVEAVQAAANEVKESAAKEEYEQDMVTVAAIYNKYIEGDNYVTANDIKRIIEMMNGVRLELDSFIKNVFE